MLLAIYGAGGLGKEILVLATQINAFQNRWERISFIDDSLGKDNIENIEMYSFIEFVSKFECKDAEVCIALGEPIIREKLEKKVEDSGYSLATLIHPSVFIPQNTRIGVGTVICVGSFISCNVEIGKNALIQPHVNVGHDCIIHDNVILSGFVNLSGACTVGERTYIGLSVCVKEKTTIGSDTIIGMGSVVSRDIPNNVIALGNPARPMKNNDEKRVFK